MAFLMALEPGIYASLNSLSFPGLLWKFSPSKSLKIPTYTCPHHTCLSFSPCIRALLPVTICRGKRDLFLHTEQSSGTRWVGILYSSSQFWKPLELTPTTWCLEGCSISLPFYNSGVHQIQCSSHVPHLVYMGDSRTHPSSYSVWWGGSQDSGNPELIMLPTG